MTASKQSKGITPATTFRFTAETLAALDALCRIREEKIGQPVSRSSWVRQCIHREYARLKGASK